MTTSGVPSTRRAPPLDVAQSRSSTGVPIVHAFPSSLLASSFVETSPAPPSPRRRARAPSVDTPPFPSSSRIGLVPGRQARTRALARPRFPPRTRPRRRSRLPLPARPGLRSWYPRVGTPRTPPLSPHPRVRASCDTRLVRSCRRALPLHSPRRGRTVSRRRLWARRPPLGAPPPRRRLGTRRPRRRPRRDPPRVPSRPRAGRAIPPGAVARTIWSCSRATFGRTRGGASRG